MTPFTIPKEVCGFFFIKDTTGVVKICDLTRHRNFLQKALGASPTDFRYEENFQGVGQVVDVTNSGRHYLILRKVASKLNLKFKVFLKKKTLHLAKNQPQI